MMKLLRTGSRIGLLVCLAATVLCSASCGCGSSANGPSSPGYSYDRDYYYPTQYYYDGNVYKSIHGSYYTPVQTDRDAYMPAADLLRQRWLAGAGYLEDAGHSRVEAGGIAGLERWDWLAFQPDCSTKSAPDDPGVASAMYAIGTEAFVDGEVYLELNWAQPPESADACWIGVFRPGCEENCWNWFKPDDQMRISLAPVTQYQTTTSDKRVYIAVVVTGRQAGVLRQVMLREYAGRW